MIELLVVLAIVVALMGLLLSAIQHVREAANRMSCQNTLKQLALGLHNYHNDHLAFPPGYISNSSNSDGTGPGWGWAAFLMPYLEQDTLHRQIDFALPIIHPRHASVRPASPKYFRCPSDDGPDRLGNGFFLDTAGLVGDLGRTNYVACYGNTPFSART